MKKFVLVLLLGLLVLVTGCSKKKSTQSEPEPDYTLEASQTIGPEGDSLVISDFSLIVPAGAFTSNAALKLYASSKDKPFGERCVTRTFKVEGFPDQYSQPLRLSLKYLGALANEGYIAAGGMSTVPGSDQMKPTFRLFHAVDSSGYLCVELPVMETSEAGFTCSFPKSSFNLGETPQILLTGMNLYDPPKETSHFRIHCLAGLKEHWKLLFPQVLEEAYDSLQALGFNLSLVPWPIEVYTQMFTFKDLDTNRHCIFLPMYGSFNLVVDEEPMIADDWGYYFIFRGTFIRELAHAILCTYDKEYFKVLLFHTVKINPQHYWLHHAVASWCEEKMVKKYPGQEYNFAPHDHNVDNPRAPFRGMQAGAKDDLKSSLDHGSGMAAMIKSLGINYRESVLLRIYDGIKAQMHPVEAIMNSVEEAAFEWWPNFFKEYIDGKLYGIPFFTFPTYEFTVDTFDVKSKSDTAASFSANYPDLSAEAFVVVLNYEDIDTVKFKVTSSTIDTEDIMLLVFAANNDTLAQHFLSEANQEVIIADVSQLIQDGYYELVPVVVNSSYKSPYTGTSAIDLEVKVIPKSGFNYNRFGLGTWVTGHWYTSDSTDYVYRVNPLYCCKGYGECSGYTFTSSWDTAFIDGHSKGSATITVDPSLSKVTSFNAIDTTWFTGDDYHYYDTIIVNISGANLPIYSTYGGNLEFSVYRTQACNYISSLSYRDQNGDDWAEVRSYECDAESDLVIYLYKE